MAAVESTYPDGRPCTFRVAGRTYESLVPEYTTDGGHLNERGRRAVAAQLLVFLAGLTGK
jgi:lysophospholipase L1-like esterase